MYLLTVSVMPNGLRKEKKKKKKKRKKEREKAHKLDCQDSHA